MLRLRRAQSLLQGLHLLVAGLQNLVFLRECLVDILLRRNLKLLLCDHIRQGIDKLLHLQYVVLGAFTPEELRFLFLLELDL